MPAAVRGQAAMRLQLPEVGVPVDDIGGTIHAHPTLGEVPRGLH